MNICFLARPSYDNFSISIYKSLIEKHDKTIGGYFITTNSKETQVVKKNLPNVKVFETSTYLRNHWESFTKEKFIDYEKKYSCEPLWKYIYTDRFLVSREYDYVIRVTAGLFSFFEEVFTNNQVDYYYSEAIATLQCYIAFIVGRKLNVKYISQMPARGAIDTQFHYLLTEEYQKILGFSETYRLNSYSDEIFTKAEKYLSDFENKDSPPKGMLVSGTKPRFRLQFIKLIALRIYMSHSRFYKDPYSYMYFQTYKNITDPIKFYFRYRRSKKYYNQANYKEKYVYYPLHYQPEASTIVCAQKYEKQLFFIDSWAKSLPADTVLYVKEHYAVLGHRELSFYKELKKFPNVVLIDPWESSRKLIENSVAVTTLTGTVGWEAMLLRKPVFLGGKIFFDNAPGIIKIDDAYNSFLANLHNWTEPSRDEVIKYLCEYFNALKKGNAFSAFPEALETENIDNLAVALYDYIIQIGNVK